MVRTLAPMTENLVVSVPEDELKALLEAEPDLSDVEFVLWDAKTPPPRTSFDITVMPYLAPPEILGILDGVPTRLVQWQAIGVDDVGGHLPDGVVFANATTVHEAATAELAVGLALAAQRRIADAVRNADKHQWLPDFQPSLADRRVLLVGYGGVAKALESRLAPFEVELVRVASSTRTEQNDAGQDVAVHGTDELKDLLPDADITIITLPLNDATEDLFDADMIAAMPGDSLLVNVGRGGVVDTDALVDALNAGTIRAALDVVNPEPLPQDHPLWDCPNLLITPHNGGDTSARLPRIAKLVHRQIDALREGREPENLLS